MHSPAVSVILPVFNGANYLRFAIDSVLNQRLTDFELIVVDDGSTDATPDIVGSYGTRLKYVRKKNGGVATAFNEGIRQSTGRYISWLSHDDVYRETKLEKQLEALAKCEGPALCYTDVQVIDTSGNVTSELELPGYRQGEALRELVTSGKISNAAYSIFFDRRCVEELGLYDEARRYTQDAEMLIRLVRRFPFIHVPEKLIKVREHDERGTRAVVWLLETTSFYEECLSKIPLEELFPELSGGQSRAEMAKAHLWLGDAFARPPFRKIALAEYGRALREDPLVAPAVARRMIKLGWNQVKSQAGQYRSVHRIGLRTAIRQKFGSRKVSGPIGTGGKSTES
jgi:glycosyltransferase involved in cell wall biosynthesis